MTLVCVVNLTCFPHTAPEVEITADSIAVVGTSLTLECSVSVVPHFITPHVELSGPGEVLANEKSLSLTHTLDPVLASHGGPYVCRAVLEIEGWDEPLVSESSVHTLTLQSKYNYTLTVRDGVISF